MPASYKLQRFRGGFAICEYRDGQRISRRQLESSNASDAAEEFRQWVIKLKRPKDPNVSTIWQLYRDDREGRVISTNMKWSGKAILPFFGAMKPDDISIQDCRKYIANRREKEIQDGTILTELGHLRGALVWAEKNKIIHKAPSIEKPSAPPARERYLTRKEFDALLHAANMPHIKLFLMLAIGTAGRASALLELTWDRVDFEREIIYLGDPQFKGKRKGRATVPINRPLLVELKQAQRGARTPYVIEWAGDKVGSVKKGIKSAAERAKIKDVSPHVLRHTAAVWMAEEGIPMPKIAQYLAHSDDRVTQRKYARFSPDHLRDAAKALEIRSAPRII